MHAKFRTPILAQMFGLFGFLTLVFGTLGALAMFVDKAPGDESPRVLLAAVALGGTFLLSTCYYGVAQILRCIGEIAHNTTILVTLASPPPAPPASPSPRPKYACPLCRAPLDHVVPGVNTCPTCKEDFMAE